MTESDVARLNGHELVAIDERLPGTEPTSFEIDLTDEFEYGLKETDPLDLPLLYNSIDPEALNRLADSTIGEQNNHY